MYEYTFNNPITLLDEDGDWPAWLKKAAKITAIVAVATVTVAAVVVSSPAVASLASATSLYYGATIGVAKVVSTAVTVGCAILATGITAIGVNKTVETVTNINYGEKIMGKENYNKFENVVIAGTIIVTSVPQYSGYPSTDKNGVNNLNEQIAIKSAKSNPNLGKVLTNVKMQDPRMPYWMGWQKYSIGVKHWGKTYDVHYVGHRFIKFFFDFKIKK